MTPENRITKQAKFCQTKIEQNWKLGSLQKFQNHIFIYSAHISRGHLVDELAYMGEEFTVAFDLYINKISAAPYQNILHLTLGRGGREIGDRIPAIWITPDRQLLVASAINGKENVSYAITDMEEKKWTTVQVSQQLKKEKVGNNIFNTYG